MTLDELDRLHAAATGQRLTPSPVAFEVAVTQAWPSISARLRTAEADVERLRGALFPIATGRFASVSEACDLAEDALGSAAVAEWNAVENARAALGKP